MLLSDMGVAESVAKMHKPRARAVRPRFFCTKHLTESDCRVPEVESIFFNLPNLHFLPCPVVASKVRPCNPSCGTCSHPVLGMTHVLVPSPLVCMAVLLP